MELSPDHVVVIYNSILKNKDTHDTFSIQPTLYEVLFLGLDPDKILYDRNLEVSAILLNKEKALQYLSNRFNIQNKDNICLSTLN